MIASSTLVTVEFYGIPRRRAGRDTVCVEAGTIVQVLNAVERMCPALAGLVEANGQLSPHYLISLDGNGFVTDLQQALPAGARVLLLSADAGG